MIGKANTLIENSERLTVNVSGIESGFEISVQEIRKVEGYSVVEYIESTGSQYIDTGFYPNYNTKIVMDVEGIGTNAQFLYGTRSESSITAAYQFSLYRSTSTTMRSDYFGTNVSVSVSDVSERMTIVKDSNVTTFLGYTITNNVVSSGTCTFPLLLFALNDMGSPLLYASYKLYSCQIYDNDILVRDYIPVKTNEGLYGLYDKVNKQFYGSASSDAFVGGAVVGDLTENGVVIGTSTEVTSTFSIPVGTNYMVSASEVSGYMKPDTQYFYAQSGKRRVVNMEYKQRTDLSMFDIYGNSIAQTTANCYIVKEARQYKFPLVYGNALKDGAINSVAYTNNGGSYSHDFVAHDGTEITIPYIEDLVGSAESAQLSIADTDGIFTNISIVDGSPCRYVQFEVASVPATGANGVISIKNSSGTIMWNWHIWVWNEDMTSIEVTNATNVKYKLLPYNLGSKWDDGAKTYIKNWYYQWGRTTPFICASAYNSSSGHASFGELNLTFVSEPAIDIYEGIQNPTKIFTSFRSNNYGWFSTENEKSYNLWDAGCTSSGYSDNDVVKTVYDPSPIGFKMPNGNAFSGFSVISEANGIAKLTRYSGDTTGIGFPLSGYRDNVEFGGEPYGCGDYGMVWKSASDDLYTGGRIYIQPNRIIIDSSYRTYGLSVRPVED